MEGTSPATMNTTTSTAVGTPNATNAPYALAYGELIFGSIVYIVIIIVGIIGNTLIILSVILSRRLRTSTNVFIVSLSTCDLITCLILPWQVVAYLGRDGWALPRAEWLCGITALVIYTGTGISLYNLAAIAINRLVYLVFPFRYVVIYRPWNIAAMIAFIWIFPAGSFIGFVAAGLTQLGYERVDYPSCSDLDDFPHAEVFNFAQTVIAFPLPMIVIIVCYTWIYVHIRRLFGRKKTRENEMSRFATSAGASDTLVKQSKHNLDQIMKEELQITKYLFIVVVAFIACFLPIFIGNALPNAGHLNFYTVLPKVANSAINFFIYASRHPQFKVVLQRMVRCQFGKIPQPSRILQAIRTTAVSTTATTTATTATTSEI